MTQIRSNNYIQEIDSLRAISVIAVIINHFEKSILPSGYLGVDIFFCISGYVITASLIKNKKLNFKNFILNFYSRRIKSSCWSKHNRLIVIIEFF